MLKRRVFAYQFDGYWKDVGTIKSLWEANMDLIEMVDEPYFETIRSRNKIYGEDTIVSLITPDERVMLRNQLLIKGNYFRHGSS